MTNKSKLSDQTFKIVVNSTPLISIDLLVKKDNKILLGTRINKPAQGYLFSIGGRVYKNESIQQATARIAKEELNISLKLTPSFIGVFEHFYDDGIYKGISTHYINLAYEVDINNEILNLPNDQHNEYQWLSINELLSSKQVHKYVKDYFRK
jgi:colanic acid biosynthesis protein WcaH